MMDGMSGAEAHANGEPISACPYAPSDPDGLAWRQAWISAEASGRMVAGTFGASDEDYRRGGMTPPDPIVRDPLARLRADIERITAQMTKQLRKVSEAMNADAESMDALREAMQSLGQTHAEAARSVHRPCPQHGPTVAGFCRPCSRQLARSRR